MSVRQTVLLNTFGEYVKGRREHLGLSLADLSDTIGIARSTICDTEKGRRFPSLERMPRWAEALDTQTAFLVHLLLQQRVNEAGLSLRVRVSDP